MASAVSMQIGRVAPQLLYSLDCRNRVVGLERGKLRLLVTVGKVVAQSKSVSHVGRKMHQNLDSVLVPGKMSGPSGSAKYELRRLWAGSRVDTEPTA